MKFVLCLAAAAIGYLQFFVVTWCMAQVALYTPTPEWFVQHGLTNSGLIAAAVAADFPIVVALWLPIALLLWRFRPHAPWLYLAFAVLPMFGWLNFGNAGQDISVLLLGLVPAIAAPIAAMLLARQLNHRREMPNNSSKPKPLRGSA